MALIPDNLTSRGVRQDFPLRHDMGITKADISTGFLRPTKSMITHPDVQFNMGNANISTTTSPRVDPQSFIDGYFFTSAALTANRTLTTPTAVQFVGFLGTLLRTTTTGTGLAGVRFKFTVDNDQGGAFTRTLVAGAGVTLQGTGFDLSQNEIGVFNLVVHDDDEVVISRENLGPSTAETLAETLVAGNTTGGTDVVITGGDSITSAGQIPLVSTQQAADAILLDASTGGGGGGIDVNVGTGGIAVDSTGAVSLDGAAASNFTVTGAGIDLTLDSAAGSVVIDGGEAIASAVRIVASNAGGGIDIDAGTGGITVDSTASVSIGGASDSDFSISGAGNDLSVNSAGGRVVLDGGEAAADAVNILASNAAGGVTITAGTAGTAVQNGLTVTSAAAAAIVGVTTLSADDSGGIFSVDQGSAYAITLPTPAQGLTFTFMLVGAAANDVTISDGAAHLFGTIVNDVTSVIPATGTTLTFASGVAAIGDNIEVCGISATQYLVRAVTSAAGGITVA